MAGYLVALTGASGAIYGIRLIEEFLKRGDDVELIISPSGFLLLEEELELKIPADAQKATAALQAFFKKRARVKGKLRCLPYNDLTSFAASGSSCPKTFIICPCSMGTLGRIASGISGNLIERAADCVLKERGKLILVPRETPLNSIHLENMLKLSNAGAVILPAMPGFYSKPKSMEDLVDFVVGKVLDVAGVENSLYKRWKK